MKKEKINGICTPEYKCSAIMPEIKPIKDCYTDTEHFGQAEGESYTTTSTDGTCTITIPKNTDENVFFTGAKTMRPCLICGDGVDELVGFGAVICDKCKEAVMYIRNQLELSSFGLDNICPKCGSKLRRVNDYLYMSIPPYYKYECNKCGHVEYKMEEI